MNKWLLQSKITRRICLLAAVGAFMLVFSTMSAVAELAGSNVTFAPSAGTNGAACFVPNRSGQTLCFKADTYTNDGEDVSSLFIRFPADWSVSASAPTVVSSSCSSGSFSGGVSWSGWSDAKQLTHTRLQNAPDHCSAVYCIQVGTGITTTTAAPVSWSWLGQDMTTAAPHRPSSSDGFCGPITPCDISDLPPASVPVCEHETITVTPESLPAGVAGTRYQQQLYPTGAGYSWSYIGSKPADLHLYTSGEIDWYDSITAGSYTFTATVQGPGWSDGSREYTLIIDPLLTFTPSVLPSGSINTAYSQAISVVGGTAPYTLTNTSGTLPSGITFSDDAFSGTPTESGTFSGIVIQAVDDNGVTKAHTYSLTVLGANLFSWDPPQPQEGSYVTFTPNSGYSQHTWTRGRDPGDTCAEDPTVAGYNEVQEIWFGVSGEYQVCLQMWDSSTSQYIYDEQMVTVAESPATIDYITIGPYPSLQGMQVNGYASIKDEDPGPFICKINWGDGSSEETFTAASEDYCDLPTHTYTTGGSFTVQVSVSENGGAFSAPFTTTHDVIVVGVEGYTEWLASDSLPTTIQLVGYAAAGVGPVFFSISQNPYYGELSGLSAAECFSAGIGFTAAVTDLAAGEGETRAEETDLQLEKQSVTRPDQPAKSSSFYPRTQVALIPDGAAAAVDGPRLCLATVVYTPYGGATDTSDSFYFTLSDGTHTSEPGLIYLWVAANGAPVALAGSETASTAVPSYITMTTTDPDWANDFTDRLTFIIDTAPLNGTLGTPRDPDCAEIFEEEAVLGISCTSAVLFTPNPGISAGTDSFTFHVNDTHQDSGSAAVTLELHAPTSLHVNTANDIVDEFGCTADHCSLREAVDASLAGDTIDFTLILPNTISLSGEQGILVSKDITIEGPGVDQLSVSGSELSRVFEFYNNGIPFSASLSGLTIKDGRSGMGGGVMIAPNADVSLEDCQIGPNNIVEVAGGGIAVEGGNAIINRCTIVGNHGTGTLGGAGIYAGYSGSSVTLVNSTVTDNVTNNFGGGILSAYGATVSLIHSTVYSNTANLNYADPNEEKGGGGGIVIIDDGEVLIQNSIVAGNTDYSGLVDPSFYNYHVAWPDVSGAFTSLGGNLIGDGTGSSGWTAEDLVGGADALVDPLVGELAVNSPGVTPTFALLEGSPAIDAAPTCAAVTDQRNVLRPQGSLCDIGSFELEQGTPDMTPPVVTVPDDKVVPLDNSSGSVVEFTATALDDVDGVLEPICAPPSGSTFLSGDTIVTCTATDAAGNIGSDNFMVTVTPNYMKVGGITLSVKQGRTNTFTGLVTILGNVGGPISKANVAVDWFHPGSDQPIQMRTAPIATTNRLGIAKFVLRGEVPTPGEYKMCVTNIVKSGFYYFAIKNDVDPCKTILIGSAGVISAGTYQEVPGSSLAGTYKTFLPIIKK